MLNQQAYLIMAHKDDKCFRTLLRMIDDCRNDIYIHMDQKNLDYDAGSVEQSIRHSNVIHTKRTKVTWGGYSQINAELILLKEAASAGKYQHYHLLSGADLPIKSQDYIYQFFINNDGMEFVNFQSDKYLFPERTKYFYPIIEMPSLNSNRLLQTLNKYSLLFQRFVNVNRNRGITFQKGANWFSITDDLARYVISKESWLHNIFEKSWCCDEVFLQTLVVNSDFRHKLYHDKFDDDYCSIMRLIDWKRGSPYVFKEADFNEIMRSEMLFARKFDAVADEKIVELIEDAFA